MPKKAIAPASHKRKSMNPANGGHSSSIFIEPESSDGSQFRKNAENTTPTVKKGRLHQAT